MPETIGLLLLGGENFTLFSIGAVSISAAQVVGTIAVLAISIGLQYALAPKVPTSSAATQQASRQNIPVRVVVMARARVAAVYMLYEVDANGNSVDVLSVCQGQIAGFVRYYLSDTEVYLDAGGSTVGTVPQYNDSRYTGKVGIRTRLGLATETAYVDAVSTVPSLWTNDHRGDGIASIQVTCNSVQQQDFLKFFPQGDPSPSVVVDGVLFWDPRDPAQDPDDSATWIDYPAFAWDTDYVAGNRVLFRGSVYIARSAFNSGADPGGAMPPFDLPTELWASVWRNPVIAFINYVINADWGMTLDRAMLIDPVKADLCGEADICDTLQLRASGGSESLYTFGGSFTYQTNPSEVIGNLNAACDGWSTLNGNGSLVIRVGQYRAPTVTLKAQHIFGMTVSFGMMGADRVNDLEISFTSPEHQYKSVPGQAWRDEDDISERGKVVSQNLDLPWVQSHGQARMLAKRATARTNAPISVTFTTKLYGVVAQGERWIRLQYPFLADLADVVIEVQDSSTFDVFAGQCTIIGKVINPNTIDAWDPDTEEGQAPPVIDDVSGAALPVPDDVAAMIIGGAISVSWDDLDRDDLSYVVRYRLVDSGSGSPGPWVSYSVASPMEEGDLLFASIPITGTAEYEVQVASSGAQGTISDWSSSTFADPPESETNTLIAAFTTAPNDLRKAYINRLVKDLKDAGVWSLLDLLYVHAAHASQAGLVNWVAPGTHNLTATNAPAFTVDQGYTGNGSNAYLDSGVAMSALAKYKQNDASVGIWSLTANVQTVGAISASGTGTMRIIPATSASNASYRMNDTTSTTVASGGVGHHAMVRAGSANYFVYKNGSVAGTVNVTSTGAPTGNLFVLRDALGSYSTQKAAVSYAGQALNSTQMAALHAALAQYLGAVGAV